MQNITIGRYNNSDKVGWFGWIEPADKSWILFIPADDSPPQVFVERTISGAVTETGEGMNGSVLVDPELAKIIDEANKE